MRITDRIFAALFLLWCIGCGLIWVCIGASIIAADPPPIRQEAHYPIAKVTGGETNDRTDWRHLADPSKQGKKGTRNQSVAT